MVVKRQYLGKDIPAKHNKYFVRSSELHICNSNALLPKTLQSDAPKTLQSDKKALQHDNL